MAGSTEERLEQMMLAMQTAMNTLQAALITMENSVTNNTNANDKLSEEVKELRSDMSKTYVRKDVLDPTLETLKSSVKSHDDWIIWVTRIVVAAVLVAVIGGVVVTGK